MLRDRSVLEEALKEALTVNGVDNAAPDVVAARDALIEAADDNPASDDVEGF